MTTEIVPYEERHFGAVRDFNRRMCAAGMPDEFAFTDQAQPEWLPNRGVLPYNERYIVLEGSAVRGVFVLKHEEFSFAGDTRAVVCCHHPYSEGVVNREYATVGVQILRFSVKRHPRMYALGMQGPNKPLPQLLSRMGWNHCLVPFYIRVIDTEAFFTNLARLRETGATRLLSTMLLKSGLAGAAIGTAQWVQKSVRRTRQVGYEIVDDFESWTNDVWRTASPGYPLLPLRTADVLRTLYPADNHNFLRLKVKRGREVLGWAVAGILQRRNDPNYGNIRLGTVLDALARPEHAAEVIWAATQAVESAGVGLIISNHSHVAWSAALSRCGFLRVPSNYVFAASPEFRKLIPLDQALPSAHLNRSGADGLFQYSFFSSDRRATAASDLDHCLSESDDSVVAGTRY